MKLPLNLSRRALPSATAWLSNCHAEALAPDAKAPARLMRAPGVRAYRTGNGPGRGLHVMGGVIYSVQGESLYADGRYIGPLPGANPVSMADNGTILVIAADGAGWQYDGLQLERIADADFPGASEFGYLDGYFVFTTPGTPEFWITGVFSTDVDALDYERADGAPDNIVTFVIDHRELVLIGSDSTELWYVSGSSVFPIERSPSGFLEIGGIGGAAKLDNSVIWEANDLTIRRLTGNVPVRISTHAVEERIRQFHGRPHAFTYALEGHLCYVISWDDGTLVFDATTGAWHERNSYRNQRWRVCACVNVGGTQYVQDRDTGGIGVLDPALETEWGETIVASWTYPAVHANGKRLFHQSLELLAQFGAGGTVLAEYRDGAGAWKSLPSRTMGAAGEYDQRVIWHKLGSSRDRVYRLTVSDGPVNVTATEVVVSG